MTPVTSLAPARAGAPSTQFLAWQFPVMAVSVGQKASASGRLPIRQPPSPADVESGSWCGGHGVVSIRSRRWLSQVSAGMLRSGGRSRDPLHCSERYSSGRPRLGRRAADGSRGRRLHHLLPGNCFKGGQPNGHDRTPGVRSGRLPQYPVTDGTDERAWPVWTARCPMRTLLRLGVPYRNRSPGRRPLVGCSQSRYARASWRWRRSRSWVRT